MLARNNLEFFLKYTNKMIRDLLLNIPCHSFFTKLLGLGYNATPNEIHRRLVDMNTGELSQLITRVEECTCHPAEHHRGYMENTCIKIKMVFIFKIYIEWNNRNISQTSCSTN